MGRRISKPLPGNQIDWSLRISQDLKRALLFNEGSGTSVMDLVRTQNTIVSSSASPLWVSNRDMSGVSLSGATPRIPIGSLGDFSNKAVTVAAWLTCTGGHSQYPNIFSCYNASFTSGFDLYLRSDISFHLSSSEAGGGVLESTTSAAGNFFACAVYSGVAAYTLNLYYNGKNIGSASGSNRTSLNSAFLGNDSTSTYYLNGIYQQFMMWDRALNADEVMQLQVDRYACIKSSLATRIIIPSASPRIPRPLRITHQSNVRASYW